MVAIPKTMDNDVAGTDYCLGFSTCVTRTIELVNQLRTSAGSHERFLVVEVFGRYAGFSALLPAMAGAGNRCIIPEHPFDMERLAEILSEDRRRNPSKYAIVIVSEGAMFAEGGMVFEGEEADAYGHKKLGGVSRNYPRNTTTAKKSASSARSWDISYGPGIRMQLIPSCPWPMATWRSTCCWKARAGGWSACATANTATSI